MIYGRRGFTIIEVMLFLAISGLLAVGILAGAGSAISQQQYKDAAVTLRSDIQQLYEDAVAIRNDRSPSVSVCGSTKAGASDCVILGSLMTLDESGAVVKYRIIGDDPLGDPAANRMTDEVSLLKMLKPRIADTTDPVDATLGWDTRLDHANSLLVIRSPRSGGTYTFTNPTIVSTAVRPDGTSDIEAMVQPGNMQRVKLCVLPNGWRIGDRLSVVVGAGATSASAVEMMSNTMLRQAGEAEC